MEDTSVIGVPDSEIEPGTEAVLSDSDFRQRVEDLVKARILAVHHLDMCRSVCCPSLGILQHDVYRVWPACIVWLTLSHSSLMLAAGHVP